MRNRIIDKVLVVCISFVIILTTTVGAFDKPIQGYQISQYDIKVNIFKDGSLDITEIVDFTFLGNSNNAVLLIDKQEEEEIEIKAVYTYYKNEWIEFEKLAEGEWGANVFNGTYSEIQEGNLVRLKVYGVFTKQQAKILVRYSVKNAIKRYNDIAVYDRNHVQRYWEGYISNLAIEIHLPGAIESNKVKSYLHGVLIGEKQVTDSGIVYYTIPNTVPGEYVEARVVFPQYLVGNAAKTSSEKYLQTILEEEKEYLESDKSDLLRARENAAKEEGRRAAQEKQKKNLQIFSIIVSLLGSFLGIITIYRTNKVLKTGEKQESFTVEDIAVMNPAEALLLTKGKTGARGILAGLFRLSARGFVEISVKNDELSFRISENLEPGSLKAPDAKLLDLLGSLVNEDGFYRPSIKNITDNNSDDSDRIKKLYNKWNRSIRKEHSQNNILTDEQLYYRNLGLILGVILFVAGCIIPVMASIWSGYLMIPVGFILFNYALGMEKKTAYSASRIKALGQLKELFESHEHPGDKLPQWIFDINLAIGFAIALGVENRLSLLKGLESDKNNSMSINSKYLVDESFEEALGDLLKNAEAVFTEYTET